tara:strand:+ start:177785 stop:179902 length:2118 start_codon:yes stop_codon:yes gene_type:complete
MGNSLQGRLLRLCAKELKETLRDRRTIVTLLLMPLLVYPLLSMALNRFLLSSKTGQAEVVYTVGAATDAESNSLHMWLQDPASQPPDEIVQASGGNLSQFQVVSTNSFSADNAMDPSEALAENLIDVAVKITSGQPPIVEFTSYRGDNDSETARRVLVERMNWLRMRQAEESASRAVQPYVPPAEIRLNSIGEQKQSPLLSTIIPLVLVLMTITGAVYPAIDLTAGERERGTMESLMASPVPRFYVLASKYVAVVTVAMLTAVANLLAMFVTLWASRLLPLLNAGDEGFPWFTMLQILGLLVLFSGFFSAVLLSLTSFAKSFKEAQAYLIPVMLVSLAPAMLSLMPGVKLSGALAIAPLINIVLLARDLLGGVADPAAALAAIVSTCAYAAAAIGVAAKLFGSDAVTRTSEQSIGSLFQRPTKVSDVPSPSSAAMMLAILVPIYFIVSNALIRLLENSQDMLSISSRLCLNAVALVATFGIVPLLVAVAGRYRLWSTYRLYWPSAVSLFGAMLVGLGAWALAHESLVYSTALGFGGLDEEKIQQALDTLAAMKQAPPLLLIATLALAPAIIEELCFRGFLFSALSKVLSPGRVIVVTAVIFGTFHVLTGNALLIERFVPTTLLGLVLGWIAHRTGSVIPGMVMHFVHNALLELVAHYHEKIEFLGDGFENQSHLPSTWILTATLIAIVGMALVWTAGKRRAEVSS